MDFSNVVSYETEFPVKLRNPVSGEEIGVTFNVVSFDSESVIRAAKTVESERWKAILESDEKKLTPEKFTEFQEKVEREQVIASIRSWDWGGHDFSELKSDAECTTENKRYVIEHQNAKWIKDQVVARASDIKNFTQGSGNKPARSSRTK